MTMNSDARKSIASLAAAIMIGLTLFKGVELLIQAAAMPLETVTVRVINALLIRGWRNVTLLDGPPDTLVVAVFTAVQGLALIAIGLGIGIRLVPHAPHE